MCFTPLMNGDAAAGPRRPAHVGHPVEKVLEHHPDLHAGQIGPQAEVGPTGTERDVRVGARG